VEATGLHDMVDISLTRQIQTKLNFTLLHALGPQNTGQVETKVLLTVFDNRRYMAFKPVLAHASCVFDIAGFG